MGVQLPGNSRDLLPTGGVSAVRGPGAGSLRWSVPVIVLLAAYGALAVRVPGSLSAFPWLLAAALAAVAWSRAARRAQSRARASFRCFQLAGLTGLAAHVVWAYQSSLGTASALSAAVLHALPDLAIAAGAALALGWRRGHLGRPRLAADALLLVLAGVAGSLRLVAEPALAANSGTPLDVAILSVLQSVAVVPVVLAAMVVLRRGTALSPWAGALILAATVGFGLDGILSLGAAAGETFPIRGATGWPELGAWLVLAAAGFTARRVPPTAHAMLARRRTPDIVRKLLVPGTALLLAAAVVDMGFGREPRPETVVAIALLALALAFRTAQAFHIADRDAEQRRQLAHTRALVEVTHALAGTTDLDEVLRVISESARLVFGTRGAGIELLTDDGASLETRSAVGLPGDVVGLRFPLEGSFTGWVVKNEEPRATVDPSRDPFIQPQSLTFLGRFPVAAAPIHFRGETLGALFACIRSEPFDAEELELMGALAEQAAIAIQHARLFERVTTLSITDPLTGLANRRQLERELAREFAAAHRGRPLAAVIFDLDGFKHYNDTYGHLAGDEALQAFAGSLREETRAMNLAARYGGDEFVALLAGADAAGARTFIERVRIRFARAVEALGHGPLTVSAGMAEFMPGMRQPEALLRIADNALYKTKPQVRA